jgi:hypothetical protein
MTRQSTAERTALLPGKAGLACIGRFDLEGGHVDFPCSEEDLQRDAASWGRVHSAYGVARGKRVVVTALPWELPWAVPLRLGVTCAGGTYSNTELWGWDARRLDLFIRRLSPYAVIGPGQELIEALAGLTDLAERLADVPVLLVRPDAVQALEDAGVHPTGIVVPLGPTSAVSLPDGSEGLAVDESEWNVEDEDGELLITTVGPRAATFHRQRTGVRGRVEQTPLGARIHLER